MTDLLITSGCSVNMPPSPICTAVIEQDIESVEWLITAGANVNIPHPFYRTALVVSGFFGKCDMMPLLLNAGARINCFNNYKMQYMYIRIQRRTMEALPLLYVAGESFLHLIKIENYTDVSMHYFIVNSS